MIADSAATRGRGKDLPVLARSASLDCTGTMAGEDVVHDEVDLGNPACIEAPESWGVDPLAVARGGTRELLPQGGLRRRPPCGS